MACNFNSALLGHKMLFPVSTSVHVSPIERGNSRTKTNLINSQMFHEFPMRIVTQDVQPVKRRYLNMISTDVKFSDEVMEERCLHMMPYSEKYFADIFQPGILKSPLKRVTTFDSYTNKRYGSYQNVMSISKPNNLLSLGEKANHKVLQLHEQAALVDQEFKKTNNVEDINVPDSSVVFITEIQNSSEKDNIKLKNFKSELMTQNKKKKCSMTADIKDDSTPNQDCIPDVCKQAKIESNSHKNDWDDYMLSELSQLTANWIVHERMPVSKQQEKLSSILKSWYGHPTHTDLMQEEVSDGDEQQSKKIDKKPQKKWKKAEASLLAKVYNVTPPPDEALDPYSNNNKAPFYRQPAGVRKKKRSEDKEVAGAVNKTARNIKVREYVETPQPKLKDLLNPKIGDKIYETDNLYQQEWLTGKSHVYNLDCDPSVILMETENKYKKQLQQEMPMKSDTWYSNNNKGKEELSPRKPTVHKQKRGLKRWIALPRPINDTELLFTMTPTEVDSSIKITADSEHRQKIRQNHVLLSIVHEWRSKCFLCGQYEDSSPDDLIRDMADIQPHVRLKAIGTVAKAVEYKQTFNSQHLNVQELPHKIFIALECLLDDNHDQVRKAAAITLYTFEKPNDKAKEILRKMLKNDNEVDRWTSAHCLAHYGECDSDIIAEVIKQILSTESAIKYEQGIHLLVKISNNSNLVHCMVAEQLNSSSWRHRTIACKILPTLFGSINKDITQKLSNMMWHDWHTEVRKAAAQCLGKTSHGRDVHDGIIEKLLHGAEKTKLEAIRKLGQLGIMTAKLLPAFLLCFTNPYVSMRCEICITCGNLLIKEEKVIKCLVHLATLDPAWKVKALAIQALGKIGEVNDKIKECLLWAVRYEDVPGVRAEACHSLVVLKIQDEDVINALQERLLVESSQIVREEITDALTLFGLSVTEDSEMVAQVKAEVYKLCHPSIITSQIIVNEMDDNKLTQLQRMVCLTKEDVEALHKNKDLSLDRIRSQATNIDNKLKGSQHLLLVKNQLNSTLPEPLSREGTTFTQAADMELEALLGHDKSESWSVSSKSRPLTTESVGLDKDKDDREPIQNNTYAQSLTINAKIDGEVDMKACAHSRTAEDRMGVEEISEKNNNLLHYLSLPPSVPRMSDQDAISPHLVRPTSGRDDESSHLVPPIRPTSGQDDESPHLVPPISGKVDMPPNLVPPTSSQDDLTTNLLLQTSGLDYLSTHLVLHTSAQDDMSPPSMQPSSSLNGLLLPLVPQTFIHNGLPISSIKQTSNQNHFLSSSVPLTSGQNNCPSPPLSPAFSHNGSPSLLILSTSSKNNLFPHSVPRISNQSELLPPSVSAVHLNYSRLYSARSNSGRLTMNKDVTEKEMFNKEISAIYLKLDARYSDLNKNLMKIDEGYDTK